MRTHILLIALLLLAPTLAPAPPDPHFAARWDTATSATISWYQASRGCLSKETALGERIFIECVERWPASIALQLGQNGPIDGVFRPHTGDVYVLQTGGQTYRARLVGRAQYLPAFRA